MRIIFLDFDGVLNTFTKFSEAGTFSKAAVSNLNRLLGSAPDLKVVISSAWRKHGLEFCKKLLEKNGIDSSIAIDCTDFDNVAEGSIHRGVYIARWLKQHPEVNHFVIIDDHSDMDDLSNHLVKTNSWIGITESDVSQALEILQK